MRKTRQLSLTYPPSYDNPTGYALGRDLVNASEERFWSEVAKGHRREPINGDASYTFGIVDGELVITHIFRNYMRRSKI